VGNPTGDLPFAEKEAKMLADKLKVTPLLKNFATRSEVLGRLSRATIIHFSCHGKTDGKSLILAPEGENNKYAKTSFSKSMKTTMFELSLS
jgi:CHAT domain-containing protein